MYDFLIVGAGLFGAVCARELTDVGKRCLIVEERNHIAGNCYTEEIEGIQVHRYGAHIFHTSNQRIWEYVNRFAKFNNFINSPIANYKGKLYNLPFNMNTFYQMWGTITPEQARKKIRQQVKEAGITNPRNLEEQAISFVGKDIYETLVKGYTEKQWGKSCTELPAFIIKRIPVRFTYDNDYFNDIWQGIPVDGYTAMVANMLEGIEVQLNTDYLKDREQLDRLAKQVIYTGSVDAFFDYKYGALEWRSLRFETEIIEKENHQGVAVMNYTDSETSYTRVIEHKHFTFGTQKNTVVTKERPIPWRQGENAYYPINDEKNQKIYENYKSLANVTTLFFGGRLGMYKYLDMDEVIESALLTVENIKGCKEWEKMI